jgi:Bacterial archaeo-eukaryotic release factor family 3
MSARGKLAAEVSRELIEELACFEADGPVLSLYLPTTLKVDERKQNEIRLKNLLKEAYAKLEALGMSSTEAGTLTDAVSNASLDRDMWTGHGRGFAVFTGRGFMRHVSLPTPVRELSVAGFRFHLKPLLDALEYRGRFWLLALSQNDVRLWTGDGVSIASVDPGSEVPRSLTDVVGGQPAGKQLRYHAGDRGSNVAVYHGVGAGKDDVKPEIEQFVRAVSDGLERFWKVDDAPVVLAGVDHLRWLYKEVSPSADRIRGEIEGNVEDVSDQDLHDQAWQIVRKQLDARRAEILERLEHSDADTPVSRELGDVVRAARDGRVDTLFIAADVECWGRFDDSERSIARSDEPMPGDVDLLDRAAVESWLKGGQVYVVPAADIPGQAGAIAGLRY